MMRFTPAGVAGHGQRSVTVAVRVDEDAAHAIEVRSAIAAAQDQMSATARCTSLRRATTSVSCAAIRASRNWRARGAVEEAVRRGDARSVGLPPGPARAGAEPLDAAHRARSTRRSPASRRGRAKRSASSRSTSATSYRLTRNLDVTAGLRYSQEHDRLVGGRRTRPQDSQAVYVGTQFRF